jgi:hypothetical protein
VVVELPLVGATATDAHPTALTGGDRSAVGQRRRGVATVPADVEGAGLRAVLEATCAQSLRDIAGVEPIAIDRPSGRRVGHP